LVDFSSTSPYTSCQGESFNFFFDRILKEEKKAAGASASAYGETAKTDYD
jgi:hypothetical protein